MTALFNLNQTLRMPSREIIYQIVDSSPAEGIIAFLSQSVIDQQFVAPLSQRDMTIEERVHRGLKSGVWLTVVSGRQIIGCRLIKTEPESRVVNFSTLVIHPDFQRFGVGTALLQRSIAVVRERFAADIIRFDTWSSNTATRHLASKFGFRKVREVADPHKRPEGVTSIEYELDLRTCTAGPRADADESPVGTWAVPAA